MVQYTAKRSKWNRVTRSNPCPICGRPDWCLTTGATDSPDAAICSRVESSKRVGTKGAGWLHKLRDDDGWRAPRVRSVKIDQSDDAVIDFAAGALACEASLPDRKLYDLSRHLGVSMGSLRRLRIGWSHHDGAFTFPMVDYQGKVRGIRLRGKDGSKWSVSGGREGLFVPANFTANHVYGALDSLLVICEGATDTAALLDLGFIAVGRPSCSGGVKLLVDMVNNWAPAEVVILADRDDPGHRGAGHLALQLICLTPDGVRIVNPPAGIKDAREWIQQGTTRDDLLDAISAAPAMQVSLVTRKVAR